MTADEFITEFNDDQFPSLLGPEIYLFSHDQPFRKTELREMERLGLIVINDGDWSYRLTLKAFERRERMRKMFENNPQQIDRR